MIYCVPFNRFRAVTFSENVIYERKLRSFYGRRFELFNGSESVCGRYGNRKKKKDEKKNKLN